MNNSKDKKFKCKYRLITRNKDNNDKDNNDKDNNDKDNNDKDINDKDNNDKDNNDKDNNDKDNNDKDNKALYPIVIECTYKGIQYRRYLGWKIEKNFWDEYRNNGIGEIKETYGKLTPKLDYILHRLREQVVKEINRELSTLKDPRKAPEKIKGILDKNTSEGAKIKINDNNYLIFTSIDKIKTEQDKISKDLRDKLTNESSKTYLDKLKILGDIEAMEGKVREVNYPDYIMKVIGEIECPGKPEMKYQFLIEYNRNNPEIGIYYGCKCIAPYNYSEEDLIEQSNKDFDDLKQVIINALNAYFPKKNFKERLKRTNNANYNTYWPFWITLNEDEDIKK